MSIGLWRSLVARPAGGRKVAGSSPVSPTHEAVAGSRNIVGRPLFLRRREPDDESDDEAGDGRPPQEHPDRRDAQWGPVLTGSEVPRLLHDGPELRCVSAGIPVGIALGPVGTLIGQPKCDEKGSKNGEDNGKDEEGHGCSIHGLTLLAERTRVTWPGARGGTVPGWRMEVLFISRSTDRQSG